LGEDKGLNEFLGLSSLVGSLTNNLDDDAIEGGLGVNIGNSNFAVLEIELLDSFLDSL
jgi:hypothetical protein